MNSMGLALIMRMGCLCSKERLEMKGKKFIIHERLGEGGFSIVELVEDTRSRVQYALKRIKCHSAEDQRIAMVEVEYHRVLKDHPGIISLVDYDLRKTNDPFGIASIGLDPGSISSEVLLLLPYYSRGTLAQELERREKSGRRFLQEKEVLRIFLAICEGVRVFHTTEPNALVHRDIKTANILLDDNFSPILMDLGSTTKARIEITDASEARKLEEVAAERSSMTYRAPELFNISSIANIDERTDIWSLGCLLFALCFFKSPFDIIHERGDSVSLAIVSGRVEIPPDSPFSPELHEFIKSILKVDQNERPFIQDVIQTAKSLNAKSQGCV